MGSQSATLLRMKGDKKDTRPGDRHKKRRMFALKSKLTPIIEKLADDAETSITHEANRLIAERLRDVGLLPK